MIPLLNQGLLISCQRLQYIVLIFLLTTLFNPGIGHTLSFKKYAPIVLAISSSYRSYTIAYSYRDGKKVKNRVLRKIDKVSDEQVRQIRLVCKVAKNEEQLITNPADIVVKETKSYLDIAVVNELWNRLKRDDFFNHEIMDSELPAHTLAYTLKSFVFLILPIIRFLNGPGKKLLKRYSISIFQG